MSKLPAKLQKALDLVLSGALSFKEIAKQCGFSADYLYQLVEGKEAHRTENGKIFYESYQKAQKQRDKEIRDLVKSNKKKAQKYVSEYLDAVSKQKGRVDHISTVTAVINALAKSTPNVEIGSFTYQKGLSPEDIFNEFKRLSGNREIASLGRTVQEASAGRAGEIPLASGARNRITQEPEDTVLPAEPEIGPVSPESEPD